MRRSVGAEYGILGPSIEVGRLLGTSSSVNARLGLLFTSEDLHRMGQIQLPAQIQI
jgi:hypothetical protein